MKQTQRASSSRTPTATCSPRSISRMTPVAGPPGKLLTQRRGASPPTSPSCPGRTEAAPGRAIAQGARRRSNFGHPPARSHLVQLVPQFDLRVVRIAQTAFFDWRSLVLGGVRLCSYSLEDEQMRSLFFCCIMIAGLGLSSAEARDASATHFVGQPKYSACICHFGYGTTGCATAVACVTEGGRCGHSCPAQSD